MNKRGFTNNEYELNEGRDYKRRKLEPASANESSVFELPEIIEIIVSYLFGASKTILAISRLSKRHYNIVHSRTMWVRLGITSSISDKEHITASSLLFILHKLRIKHIRLKMEAYAVEIDKLNLHDYGSELELPDMDPVPHSSQPDPDFYCEEFYTNTILTDEACTELLQMIQKTQAISFRLDEFIEVITCSQAQLAARYVSSHEIRLRNVKSLLSDGSVCMDLVRYPGYYAPSKILRPLILLSPNGASRDGDHIKCGLWKAFINEHKSVTFFYSRVIGAAEINDKLMFIRYNSQTNLIEICGSFEAYAIKTFGNTIKAINQAFNTILEAVDDGYDHKWITEFTSVDWSMGLLHEDCRTELEASWYKDDNVGQNIKFFRDNKQH